jgi:dolichol-phosphate mannosyltransferase
MRNTQGKDISLSVIMPGLNEEENIRASVAELLATLGDAVVDWEVIIIDDGSTDRTGEIAEEFARVDSRIRVLHHRVPMGIGYSLFEGIRSSTKEAVTWVPADGENDPRELLKYLPLIQHVDIVIPFVVNKRVRPLFRRILSAVYLAIINATFRTRFNYTNGNIIYRKRVFDIVTPRSNGFLVHAECLVRAIKAGFTFAEVPVILSKRVGGDSKAFLFRSFFSVVREYIAFFFSFYIGAWRKAVGKRGRGSV